LALAAHTGFNADLRTSSGDPGEIFSESAMAAPAICTMARSWSCILPSRRGAAGAVLDGDPGGTSDAKRIGHGRPHGRGVRRLLPPFLGLRGGLREDLMSLEHLLGLAVAILVLAYLVFALIRAERF
jgi:hypothetical protein